MPRLILAICPTNQDPNPVLIGTNEMAHIAPLAAAILAEAQRHPAIVARVLTANPQSADQPPGSLAGLVEQQRGAAGWLAWEGRDVDLTVSLNLHSDSGTYSHCGYYYDGPGTVSEWLGKALSESIKGWFGGKVITADYSHYIFAKETRHVACPVLLEMGAHTILADVLAVRDHAPEIAATLVGTLVGFFGLETSPPLDVMALRTYADWSLARLANGQDPRSLGDFGLHLAALGCDPADPAMYVVPGLV